MTYEEAKAYFEMRLIDTHNMYKSRQREAFKVALECIEAQIPHPVSGDLNLWTCPNCGNEYEWTPARPRYCDNCGQAFDLSGVPKWEEQWGDENDI